MSPAWLRRCPVAVLLAVSAGLMALNVLDDPLSTRPLRSDETWHLLAAVHYGRCFSGAPEAPPIWAVDRHYPPLVTALAGGANCIFGEGGRLAIAVVSLFIPVLLVSVFGLARRFGLPPLSALAAALSLLFSRRLFSMSREFMFDFPLVAMVALSAWAFFAAGDFKQRGPALLAGACLGLAALTKWTAPLYLAPPVLFAGMRAWPDRAGRKRWFAALGVAALLAAPWYGPNLGSLAGVAADHAFSRVGLPETGAQFPSLWSMRAWTAYQVMLIRMWQWPLLLLAMLGFLSAFSVRGRTARPLAGWIAASFVLVSLLPPRDPRFIAPLLPALAVAAMLPCEFRVFSGSMRREAVFASALLAAIALGGDLPGVRPLPILEKLRERWEYQFDHKWNGPPPPSRNGLAWTPDPQGLALALEASDPRLGHIADDCCILLQDIGAPGISLAILAKYQAFLDGARAGFNKAGSTLRLQPARSPACLKDGRLPGDVDGVLMLELDERFHASQFEWPSVRSLGPDWVELQCWPISESHSARLFIRTRRLQ